MQPLVSIVTPSFNQGRYIDTTIRSVRAQTYGRIEHLVYDAGSRDETAAILYDHRDHVNAVIEPDRGQADAINKGLRAARGEIVAWLNSDDVYLPDAIATAVAHLVAHPELAMVYAEAEYIDADGRRIGRYPTAPLARLRDGCFICQPATFMRRQAVATVGYLDVSLQYCMDYDLWLRLASCFRIGYVAHMLAQSRLHADAKTIARQLAFHREVVEMTHRRLGATPLAWLYGYARLLVRERYTARPRWQERTLTLLTTLQLSARYHRRVSAADVRGLLRAVISPPAGPTGVASRA